MRPSADAALEPALLAVSVRLYASNGASLGPPPGILLEGLAVTLGFGFGLLAGFGFGLLAAGAPVCFSGLAASVDGVMITSLIKGLCRGNSCAGKFRQSGLRGIMPLFPNYKIPMKHGNEGALNLRVIFELQDTTAIVPLLNSGYRLLSAEY